MFADNCARCHSSKQPPNLCLLGHAVQGRSDRRKFRLLLRLDAQRGAEAGFPQQQLSCRPTAAFLFRKSASTPASRWPPTRSATTSGTTSPPRPTKSCRRPARSRVYNPVDGTPRQYEMPGGGRGYVRPASLVSLWSSAPYLQNNSVGKFNGDPSVDGRMKAFEDGIEQDAVAGKARQGSGHRRPHSRPQQDPAHHAAQLHQGPGRVLAVHARRLAGYGRSWRTT